MSKADISLSLKAGVTLEGRIKYNIIYTFYSLYYLIITIHYSNIPGDHLNL
jgi:hypothetical protein